MLSITKLARSTCYFVQKHNYE